MSQFRKDIVSPRRLGQLGIHSLDHFALVVPDLTRASDFFTSFGLELRPDGNVIGIYTFGQSHRYGILIEGPAKRLHHLSFGIFEDDFERFKAHIARSGVAFVKPPPEFMTSGLWFRDPDGTLIEIRIAQRTSPEQKKPCDFISTPPGKAGAPKRSQVPLIKPSRLAHCLIFTRDVSVSVSFFSRVLGLRLSDRSGDNIAFMHGVHGSDHHMVAFARSNGPGLHHSSWDVRSIDEIGLGSTQMAAKGYTEGWGLGRHVLGSNYFHYVRDPWGSYAEYSCDMDYIPVHQDWHAGNHDSEDAFYVWGPRPPIDWTQNHEVTQANYP